MNNYQLKQLENIRRVVEAAIRVYVPNGRLIDSFDNILNLVELIKKENNK